MYERSYGSKYDVPEQVFGTKYPRTSDIAKLVRADIKEAIKSGDLPGKVSYYSVRTETYSGGSSINITLKDEELGIWRVCPGVIDHPRIGTVSCGNVWCKNGGEMKDSPHASEHEILTDEAGKAVEVLKGILASYNHDGSDSMVDYFDVRFYGSVYSKGGRVL